MSMADETEFHVGHHHPFLNVWTGAPGSKNQDQVCMASSPVWAERVRDALNATLVPAVASETGDWEKGDLVEYNDYGVRFTARLTKPDGGRCWKAIVETIEGRHELDEPADAGDEVSVVYGHSVKIAAKTVVDSELRDRLIAAVAGDQGMIPDEDDAFEWQRIRGDVDAVLAVVAPALSAAYLSGHDSGYAAANVADPWAGQPIADNELPDQVFAELDRHLYWHPGKCGCGWKIDDAGDADWSLQYRMHVAQSVVDSRVAPVLAARDAEIDKLNLEIQGYQVGDGYEKGHQHGSSLAAQLRGELQRERESRWGLIDALRARAELAEGERGKANQDNESLARRLHLRFQSEEKLRTELDGLKAKADMALHGALSCCDTVSGECDGKQVAEMWQWAEPRQPDTEATGAHNEAIGGER